LLYARKLQREVAKGRPFDCLLAGDAELRQLNGRFRGKDYATDVLSFPSEVVGGSGERGGGRERLGRGGERGGGCERLGRGGERGGEREVVGGGGARGGSCVGEGAGG
jgi:hypothetical protein